ncbi:MAG: hypothetical protein ABR549_03860 [Mycobacteriales bacterium]
MKRLRRRLRHYRHAVRPPHGGRLRRTQDFFLLLIALGVLGLAYDVLQR